MAFDWYFQRRGREFGPYSAAQLKELAALGGLEPHDMVRRSDRTEAVTAAKIKGLFPDSMSQTRREGGTTAQSAPDSSDSMKPFPVPPPLPTTAGRPYGIGERLKGLGDVSKAACHLAAAQARQAHLVKLILPAAYLALGRDIYIAGRFRDGFPELYAEIDGIERQMKRSPSARPQVGPSKGLAERAAHVAEGVKAQAQAKALSLKKESLLRRLGESAYGRCQKESGPEHLVRPIAEALSAIESLDEEMGRLAGVGRGTWITPNRVLWASAAVGLALLALAARRPGGEAASRLGPPQEVIETSTSAAAPARAHEGSRWVPAAAGDDSTAAFFRGYPDSATSGEFVGKRLVVSGGRVSLAELDGGVAQLHLQTTFRGVSALCKFPPSEAKAAWSWKAPTYTVEGTFEGSPRDGFVELADCRLVAGAGSPPHDGDATLPSIEQFLTMIGRAGEVKNPRKGLPILVASRYELRAALGEPTNVLSSVREFGRGTHEVLDYACSDGRVLLSVTYDGGGAWIKEVAPQRSR